MLKPFELLELMELVHLSRRPGARLGYLFSDEVGPFTPQLFRQLVPNLLDRDV
jgi:hypothetical protein